jgi:Domain of unknown function DUF21.
MDLALLVGIFFCLTQSAVFSGLTLGLFGLSRLKLEIEVESGNQAAASGFRSKKGRKSALDNPALGKCEH